MASLGCDVQTTSIEIVSLIEEMKERSTELGIQIERDTAEKNRLLAEAKALEKRLAAVEEGLAIKVNVKNEVDRSLDETQAAFKEILDASKKILTNARQSANRNPSI
ncbi:Sjoegren syndrome nuclear autoantigen 1 [Angomonas deanei]|uniref:Uncharacterized protein n=1 Tax=Angomonas deanei TaxID=59799 RepID=S9VG48_9TRYP|nr:Sjoegren syndrome nuclear autoantigen 1 [Angomonas deanei]EPY41798.1 Sjoegren syndrome nuclear autoantigen 1 [Angomonas deanei]CAD2214754.1 hypothetical protein, conserved [Angomonas deanei]|eukprot:EPY41782.1 Sjoegren syndrome nuclear autoantigen 1 [Angomonas deanei]